MGWERTIFESIVSSLSATYTVVSDGDLTALQAVGDVIVANQNTVRTLGTWYESSSIEKEIELEFICMSNRGTDSVTALKTVVDACITAIETACEDAVSDTISVDDWPLAGSGAGAIIRARIVVVS